MFFSQFAVLEPEWPVQRPELKPTQHLWDEKEHRCWVGLMLVLTGAS